MLYWDRYGDLMGFHGILWGFHGILWGFYGDVHVGLIADSHVVTIDLFRDSLSHPRHRVWVLHQKNMGFWTNHNLGLRKMIVYFLNVKSTTWGIYSLEKNGVP